MSDVTPEGAPDDSRELTEMVAALADAPPIYRPSAFWTELNAGHRRALDRADGYGQFKRTVNNSYFQFGLTAFRRTVPILVRDWLLRPDLAVLGAHVEGGASTRYERALAVAIALYAHSLSKGRTAISSGPLVSRTWEARSSSATASVA